MKGKSVTMVVHVDGDLTSRQYRVPLWALEAGKWGAVTVALLVVLFFAFAAPITHAAARVPGLEQEITRLRTENGRVAQLAAALNRAEANYQAMRQLLGVRAPQETAPTVETAGLIRALPVRVRSGKAEPRYEAGLSEPSHWPLDEQGFITRQQIGEGDPAESHPGIDIAVSIGSAVRASGGGVVEAAGADSAYGLFVLLKHPSGYETMYGHASRLLVQNGDTVFAGQVIALSGNTGRSSAPHLHFEVRRDGKSLDPLTIAKEDH